MKYFETSAKLNKNIDELMQHLMEKVYQKMFSEPVDDGRGKSIALNRKDQKGGKDGSKKSGGCCK